MNQSVQLHCAGSYQQAAGRLESKHASQRNQSYARSQSSVPFPLLWGDNVLHQPFLSELSAVHTAGLNRSFIPTPSSAPVVVPLHLHRSRLFISCCEYCDLGDLQRLSSSYPHQHQELCVIHEGGRKLASVQCHYLVFPSPLCNPFAKKMLQT